MLMLSVVVVVSAGAVFAVVVSVGSVAAVVVLGVAVIVHTVSVLLLSVLVVLLLLHVAVPFVVVVVVVVVASVAVGVAVGATAQCCPCFYHGNSGGKFTFLPPPPLTPPTPRSSFSQIKIRLQPKSDSCGCTIDMRCSVFGVARGRRRPTPSSVNKLLVDLDTCITRTQVQCVLRSGLSRLRWKGIPTTATCATLFLAAEGS